MFLRNERRGWTLGKGEHAPSSIEEVASVNTVEGRISFFINSALHCATDFVAWPGSQLPITQPSYGLCVAAVSREGQGDAKRLSARDEFLETNTRKMDGGARILARAESAM
jgi:hypothetical protein